jgi:hypothetical protein
MHDEFGRRIEGWERHLESGRRLGDGYANILSTFTALGNTTALSSITNTPDIDHQEQEEGAAQMQEDAVQSA